MPVRLTSTIAVVFFLYSVESCFSQSAQLNLSSAETDAGGTIQLEISLDAPSNSQPASLQWTLQVPPAFKVVSVLGTKNISTAGKTLVCNKATCLVYGVNRAAIPNGSISVIKIKVDQDTVGKQHIQISKALASSPDGKAIPLLPGNALVTVSSRARR